MVEQWNSVVEQWWQNNGGRVEQCGSVAQCGGAVWKGMVQQ